MPMTMDGLLREMGSMDVCTMMSLQRLVADSDSDSPRGRGMSHEEVVMVYEVVTSELQSESDSRGHEKHPDAVVMDHRVCNL